MNIDYDLVLYLLVATSAVSIVLLMFTSIYYLLFWSVSARKLALVPHSEKKSKFAILIAARNESNVISNILESLNKQTYPREFFEAYVIVESEDDPTIEIVKKYGYQYFVRDRLDDSRRTKGFALQECIDYLWRENIQYDAYMIFDADNVLEPKYIEVMNDVRQMGVQVGLGYRNFTNADTNWVTANCAVMFSYMNQITSYGRSIIFHKATLMGTGYFVDDSLIREIGEWIFTGMTEDIQLTTYCYYHDIYMMYYPAVCFYDEQASDMKTVHNQHVRWLAGYMEPRNFMKKVGVKKDYHPSRLQKMMTDEFRIGILPLVIFNIISVLVIAAGIVFGVFSALYGVDYQTGIIFATAAFQASILYMIFVLVAMLAIIRNRKYLKLSPKNQILCILTYMFYFYDFLWAFFDLLTHPKKKKSWVRIDHTGEINNKDIKDNGK